MATHVILYLLAIGLMVVSNIVRYCCGNTGFIIPPERCGGRKLMIRPRGSHCVMALAAIAASIIFFVVMTISADFVFSANTAALAILFATYAALAVFCFNPTSAATNYPRSSVAFYLFATLAIFV